jgi:hypothetical protein
VLLARLAAHARALKLAQRHADAFEQGGVFLRLAQLRKEDSTLKQQLDWSG